MLTQFVTLMMKTMKRIEKSKFENQSCDTFFESLLTVVHSSGATFTSIRSHRSIFRPKTDHRLKLRRKNATYHVIDHCIVFNEKSTYGLLDSTTTVKSRQNRLNISLEVLNLSVSHLRANQIIYIRESSDRLRQKILLVFSFCSLATRHPKVRR